MATDRSLTKAAAILANAQRVVCLTGAGVSAESGVATFRDAQSGLWSTFDPQQLASQEGFAANPGLVWRWYMRRLEMVEQAAPNPGHLALAELEHLLPNFTLITQNVDNLHERAGSHEILHLHGSIVRFRCNQCGEPHMLQDAERQSEVPPHCASCGGLVRPAVVWFGEMLPGRVTQRAYLVTESCDVMLVVGTSGVVYPAAQLPQLAKNLGAAVIDVNPEYNPIAEIADVVLQKPGGKILPRLVAHLKEVRSSHPSG